MTLEDEFRIRNRALIATCRRLSSAVLLTDCKLKVSVSSLLANIAQTLAGAGSWPNKAAAASDIRELLHNEGFAEQPAPSGYPAWYADVCTLMEHSTIYEEACYALLKGRDGGVAP